MTDADVLTRSDEHIAEIADSLGLSDGHTAKAQLLAERADMEHPINRSPAVVAAGSVYLAGLLVNEKHTQPVVAEAAGVSEAALRACYREQARHEGLPLRDRSQSADKQTGWWPSLRRRVGAWLSGGGER
jgi:transcription initiation factor TFIIIB Brf1 subunit/transcription initiation factor TFIIB